MSAAKKMQKFQLIQGEGTVPFLETKNAGSVPFYQLLFHEANDAILLINQDDRKILAANRRLQELTGYTGNELEGKLVDQLFPEPNDEKVMRVRSTLFSKELIDHSGFYEDMVLLRKDGYLSFATLSVKTLTEKQTGNQNVSFCILHDMGEKKNMERDLIAKHWELKNAYQEMERVHMEVKSAQEALVQAGKLAALGELAAGVAHELNQPLTGLLGFGQELESLLKEKLPDPVALDHMEEILKNGVRMKKIIQQLREFTRKSVEDYQNTNVLVVIEDSLKLLEQQFRSRGIAVSIMAEPGIPEVFCNPFQIEQVFINLATNARDAIEANGKGSGHIDIELRKKASDPKRFIEIRFKDDGCGMNTETKNRAFDPFYTTKEVGKGTGLGLSVSYGILSKIHGTMMIESSAGKGASFLLTLPIDYRTHHQEDSSQTHTGEEQHG